MMFSLPRFATSLRGIIMTMCCCRLLQGRRPRNCLADVAYRTGKWTDLNVLTVVP